MHQLGVHLVLVVGSSHQIDTKLRTRGVESQFVGEYRVTDPVAMQVGMPYAFRRLVSISVSEHAHIYRRREFSALRGRTGRRNRWRWSRQVRTR
jgi:hypothetical protein